MLTLSASLEPQSLIWKKGLIVSSGSVRRSEQVHPCIAQGKHLVNICYYYFSYCHYRAERGPVQGDMGLWWHHVVPAQERQAGRQAGVGGQRGASGLWLTRRKRFLERVTHVRSLRPVALLFEPPSLDVMWGWWRPPLRAPWWLESRPRLIRPVPFPRVPSAPTVSQVLVCPSSPGQPSR